MAEILKISDLTEGKFLAFDLHDLVALIPSEGERLTWCVFPMGESLEVSGDGFPYGLTAEEFGYIKFTEQINIFGSFRQKKDRANNAVCPVFAHGNRIPRDTNGRKRFMCGTMDCCNPRR
jgi:hypothetical protein